MSAARRTGPWRRADEAGFASLVVVGLTAVLMVATLAATLVGSVLEARHRALASADLAALAGAQAIQTWEEPCLEAARIAAEHGQRLESCQVSGDEVTVGVSAMVVPVAGLQVVPSMSASARAGPVGG